ncbi:uncharacterized protein LOC119025869 [Acanthopagrus latus]|uniref:uncharacterized protein LOC119025869 n=1 Tax=Acanthopagrus latus TaxID=8177 RepID=UPI00187C2BB6|nr:uncharacterized protein LOC119025869 [Acanthopagrus latus]
MVTMFSLNRAALLQLLVMCQVFAGHCLVHHWDILVSRGESVTLTCNTSEEKITQVQWTNDRFSFIHSILLNKTFSNLTSHRLTIDGNLSLNLNVFNATHEDSGLYTCTGSGERGTWTTEWNMTVSEAPEGVSSSWDFLYILIYSNGLLLCVIITAVCLCSRKRWTETPNQDSVSSRTLSRDQFHVQLGGKVSPPQYQSCVVYRMNHQQRETRGSVQCLV